MAELGVDDVGRAGRRRRGEAARGADGGGRARRRRRDRQAATANGRRAHLRTGCSTATVLPEPPIDAVPAPGCSASVPLLIGNQTSTSGHLFNLGPQAGGGTMPGSSARPGVGRRRRNRDAGARTRAARPDASAKRRVVGHRDRPACSAIPGLRLAEAQAAHLPDAHVRLPLRLAVDGRSTARLGALPRAGDSRSWFDKPHQARPSRLLTGPEPPAVDRPTPCTAALAGLRARTARPGAVATEPWPALRHRASADDDLRHHHPRRGTTPPAPSARSWEHESLTTGGQRVRAMGRSSIQSTWSARPGEPPRPPSSTAYSS